MKCPNCAASKWLRNHCRVCNWKVCRCGTTFDPEDAIGRRYPKPEAKPDAA